MRNSNMLRCYDNGGKTYDRYTILPCRAWRDYQESPGLWFAIGASAHPFDPQGFGQTCTAMAGRHLGKRVPFDDLPPDVQRFALSVFQVSRAA
jgi:hypothetical protein